MESKTFEDHQRDASARGCKQGMEKALEIFFGVTRARLGDDAISIQCYFKAEAREGMSNEERMVQIDTANSPEDNMRILSDALARQRWYASHRENVPGVPPAPPATLPDDEGLILGGEEEDRENEVILTPAS